METEGENEAFVCGTCYGIFDSEDILRIHSGLCTELKPQVCHICHEVFNTESQLVEHHATLHAEGASNTDDDDAMMAEIEDLVGVTKTEPASDIESDTDKYTMQFPSGTEGVEPRGVLVIEPTDVKPTILNNNEVAFGDLVVKIEPQETEPLFSSDVSVLKGSNALENNNDVLKEPAEEMKVRKRKKPDDIIFTKKPKIVETFFMP